MPRRAASPLPLAPLGASATLVPELPRKAPDALSPLRAGGTASSRQNTADNLLDPPIGLRRNGSPMPTMERAPEMLRRIESPVPKSSRARVDDVLTPRRAASPIPFGAGRMQDGFKMDDVLASRRGASPMPLGHGERQDGLRQASPMPLPAEGNMEQAKKRGLSPRPSSRHLEDDAGSALAKSTPIAPGLGEIPTRSMASKPFLEHDGGPIRASRRTPSQMRREAAADADLQPVPGTTPDSAGLRPVSAAVRSNSMARAAENSQPMPSSFPRDVDRMGHPGDNLSPSPQVSTLTSLGPGLGRSGRARERSSSRGPALKGIGAHLGDHSAAEHLPSQGPLLTNISPGLDGSSRKAGRSPSRGLLLTSVGSGMDGIGSAQKRSPSRGRLLTSVDPSIGPHSQAAERPKTSEEALTSVGPGMQDAGRTGRSKSRTPTLTTVGPGLDVMCKTAQRPSSQVGDLTSIGPGLDGITKAPDSSPRRGQLTSVGPGLQGTGHSAERSRSRQPALTTIGPGLDGISKSVERPSSRGRALTSVGPGLEGISKAPERSPSRGPHLTSVGPGLAGMGRAEERSAPRGPKLTSQDPGVDSIGGAAERSSSLKPALTSEEPAYTGKSLDGGSLPSRKQLQTTIGPVPDGIIRSGERSPSRGRMLTSINPTTDGNCLSPRRSPSRGPVLSSSEVERGSPQKHQQVEASHSALAKQTREDGQQMFLSEVCEAPSLITSPRAGSGSTLYPKRRSNLRSPSMNSLSSNASADSRASDKKCKDKKKKKKDKSSKEDIGDRDKRRDNRRVEQLELDEVTPTSRGATYESFGSPSSPDSQGTSRKHRKQHKLNTDDMHNSQLGSRIVVARSMGEEEPDSPLSRCSEVSRSKKNKKEKKYKTKTNDDFDGPQCEESHKFGVGIGLAGLSRSPSQESCPSQASGASGLKRHKKEKKHKRESNDDFGEPKVEGPHRFGTETCPAGLPKSPSQVSCPSQVSEALGPSRNKKEKKHKRDNDDLDDRQAEVSHRFGVGIRAAGLSRSPSQVSCSSKSQRSKEKKRDKHHTMDDMEQQGTSSPSRTSKTRNRENNLTSDDLSQLELEGCRGFRAGIASTRHSRAPSQESTSSTLNVSKRKQERKHPSGDSDQREKQSTRKQMVQEVSTPEQPVRRGRTHIEKKKVKQDVEIAEDESTDKEEAPVPAYTLSLTGVSGEATTLADTRNPPGPRHDSPCRMVVNGLNLEALTSLETEPSSGGEDASEKKKNKKESKKPLKTDTRKDHSAAFKKRGARKAHQAKELSDSVDTSPTDQDTETNGVSSPTGLERRSRAVPKPIDAKKDCDDTRDTWTSETNQEDTEGSGTPAVAGLARRRRASPKPVCAKRDGADKAEKEDGDTNDEQDSDRTPLRRSMKSTCSGIAAAASLVLEEEGSDALDADDSEDGDARESKNRSQENIQSTHILPKNLSDARDLKPKTKILEGDNSTSMADVETACPETSPLSTDRQSQESCNSAVLLKKEPSETMSKMDATRVSIDSTREVEDPEQPDEVHSVQDDEEIFESDFEPEAEIDQTSDAITDRGSQSITDVPVVEAQDAILSKADEMSGTNAVPESKAIPDVPVVKLHDTKPLKADEIGNAGNCSESDSIPDESIMEEQGAKAFKIDYTTDGNMCSEIESGPAVQAVKIPNTEPSKAGGLHNDSEEYESEEFESDTELEVQVVKADSLKVNGMNNCRKGLDKLDANVQQVEEHNLNTWTVGGTEGTGPNSQSQLQPEVETDAQFGRTNLPEVKTKVDSEQAFQTQLQHKLEKSQGKEAEPSKVKGIEGIEQTIQRQLLANVETLQGGDIKPLEVVTIQGARQAVQSELQPEVEVAYVGKKLCAVETGQTVQSQLQPEMEMAKDGNTKLAEIGGAPDIGRTVQSNLQPQKEMSQVGETKPAEVGQKVDSKPPLHGQLQPKKETVQVGETKALGGGTMADTGKTVQRELQHMEVVQDETTKPAQVKGLEDGTPLLRGQLQSKTETVQGGERRTSEVSTLVVTVQSELQRVQDENKKPADVTGTVDSMPPLQSQLQPKTEKAHGGETKVSDPGAKVDTGQEVQSELQPEVEMAQDGTKELEKVKPKVDGTPPLQGQLQPKTDTVQKSRETKTSEVGIAADTVECEQQPEVEMVRGGNMKAAETQGIADGAPPLQSQLQPKTETEAERIVDIEQATESQGKPRTETAQAGETKPSDNESQSLETAKMSPLSKASACTTEVRRFLLRFNPPRLATELITKPPQVPSEEVDFSTMFEDTKRTLVTIPLNPKDLRSRYKAGDALAISSLAQQIVKESSFLSEKYHNQVESLLKQLAIGKLPTYRVAHPCELCSVPRYEAAPPEIVTLPIGALLLVQERVCGQEGSWWLRLAECDGWVREKDGRSHRSALFAERYNPTVDEANTWCRRCATGVVQSSLLLNAQAVVEAVQHALRHRRDKKRRSAANMKQLT